MEPATLIRRTREAAGLSQIALAKRAGTSQPTLSAYESGARVPGERTLRRLLDAAGVRPSDLIDAHREEVLAVCAAHGATDVRMIGSVARGEDTVGSDVDLLVRFRPGVDVWDHADLVDALSGLLGRRVDVISERALALPDDAHMLRDARPL